MRGMRGKWRTGGRGGDGAPHPGNRRERQLPLTTITLFSLGPPYLPVHIAAAPEHSGRHVVHPKQQVQAVRRRLDGDTVPAITVTLHRGLEEGLAPGQGGVDWVGLGRDEEVGK